MSASPTHARIASGIFGGILLTVAIVLFAGIYLLVPDTFVALLWIGSLALVFSILCYVFQAFTTSPVLPRAASWGFMAMGFTVLLGTLLFPPANVITAVVQLIGIILVLLLLAVWVAVIAWRARGRANTARREAERAEWRQSPPPSAFEYSTAKVPGVSTPPVSPPAGTTTPPSGGPK